jgi:hypothetical protein
MSLIPLDSDTIQNVFLKFYSYDAISLLVDIMEYLSTRYRELLVELHTEDERKLQLKKILILKFEIVAKICHYVENFGAFGYSFSKTHPNRNMVTNVFRMIADYDVDAVKSFCERFVTKGLAEKKNLLKLERIFCYPVIASPNPSLSLLLSNSLQNLSAIIEEIGSCYVDVEKKLNLKEDYNSYKHGYRLLFAKEMQNDIDTVVFINKGGSKDVIPVDEESVKVYTDLKNKCVLLFKIMLHNHRIKQELIKENVQSKRVRLLFVQNNNNILSKSLDVVIKYHNGGRVDYLSSK